MKNNFHITPSLSQGESYCSYQKKKGKGIDNTSLVEGFDSQISPFLQTSQQRDLSKTSLTQQTKDLLTNTQQILSDSKKVEDLKKVYKTKLTEYEKLIAKIKAKNTDYINRVSNTNSLLNKTVVFTDGKKAYVTKQGVLKYIPSDAILKSMQTTGCGIGIPTSLTIAWKNEYMIPGNTVTISDTIKLITGTPMKLNQACGNEGGNVFVNSLLSDPVASEYLGCYNNFPPTTYTQFSPINMPSTNSVNGFSAKASTSYSLDNDWLGPYKAFDGKPETFWHSHINRTYVGSTGVYVGNNKIEFTGLNGVKQTVKGEWLSLTLPSPIVLTKYEIKGRIDFPGRDPNTWYILGKNSNGWSQVDYQSEVSFGGKLKSFIIRGDNTNPYSEYAILITKVGCPTCTDNKSCVQIATWNLFKTNTQNPGDSSMTQSSLTGYVTYDDCKNHAIQNSKPVFGLQNAGTDGKGLCMVGNDTTNPLRYGKSYNYNCTTIWTSSNNNNPGSYAVLNKFGSLQVLNSSNVSVYTSDATKATPSNYMGCYQDGGLRALPTVVNNFAFNSDITSCYTAAKNGNYNYFGLQSTNLLKNGGSQCFLGNDFSKATSYGQSLNCQLYKGTMGGGGWSNAIYSTNTSTGSNYYLILEDSGNMCIYRGTGPTDNQGLIWKATLTGPKKNPNPAFSAENGKFGVNYMVSGTSLNFNEFIGNKDGSMYLMMMSTGYLELKTCTEQTSCSVDSNNNYVGGVSSNAVYKIPTGYSRFLNLFGFVDANSKLYTYPQNKLKYIDDYTENSNTYLGNYDLPGPFTSGSVAQCKTSCNSNANCVGFVFKDGNCWGKTKYPITATQTTNPSDNISFYARKIGPIPPVGALSTTTNIDSVQYFYYDRSRSDIPSTTGLMNATSAEKQQIIKLQKEIDNISNQIARYNKKYFDETVNINVQSGRNNAGLSDYSGEITRNKISIHNEEDNLTKMDNIEKQVSIKTLQQNYQYMFLTILVGAAILIIMNIKKNVVTQQ